MSRFILMLLVLIIAVPAGAVEPPVTETQKTLYAIGLTVARQISVFNLSADELDQVMLGVKDAQAGKKSDVDPALYSSKIQELAKQRRKEQGEKLASVNKAYLETAAKEPGAVTTGSGLVYIATKEGTGSSPKATDTIKVNYRGTLPDGREFDSSHKRGRPLELRLGDVIKCWTEGLQKMKVGGKSRLVCPSSIAYGDNGSGEMILPGATLDFEVELLDVKAATTTPLPVKVTDPTKSSAIPAPAK